MGALITGIGWITPGGIGSGRSRSRLCLESGALPKISRSDVVGGGDKGFGRMDDFSKTGLAAIGHALRDAGLDQWTQKREIGIVAASTYGCLQTDMAYFETVLPMAGQGASPHLFVYTLPSTFLGEAAIRFGLGGEAIVVGDAAGGGAAALAAAEMSLDWGDETIMLAGICDLACPVDLVPDRSPLTGSLFLVLEKMARRGIMPYGTLAVSPGQEVFFNNKGVDGITGLAQACLSAFHTKG